MRAYSVCENLTGTTGYLLDSFMIDKLCICICRWPCGTIGKKVLVFSLSPPLSDCVTDVQKSIWSSVIPSFPIPMILGSFICVL